MPSDTKRRILDAAEQLIGDKGFPSTSMRDITKAASVNLASVNYHFGSKEALLAAVLERRLQPINERRLQLLDEIERQADDSGGEPALYDIVRAFLSPPFEHQEQWGNSSETFLRLLGRIHAETNEEFRQEFMSEFEMVFQRFETALQRCLPHLTHSDIPWRLLFMVGSMAFTMSWGQSLLAREPIANNKSDDILEGLITYTCAGLAAPVHQKVSRPQQLQETQ